MKREYLTHFNIAGFTYYDGPLVFEKLRVGKKLTLRLEEDNKYDPKAVAIYYKNSKIGFVPRQENRVIYKLLKIGFPKHIEVRVQRIDATAYPEEQVHVATHLIEQKSN